jgi:glycosyltransferase involved in cell wall biosynthesis
VRIGLYSPFFGSTVGGGEKYFGVAAEALRDAFPSHDVEIVSAVPPDVERYRRMLGLDLTGISLRSGSVGGVGFGRRVRRIPLVRRYADLYLAARAAAWTRDYDLFLSMVYVMPAFSKARRGVILCQFPYQLGGTGGRTGVKAALYRAYVAPYELLKRLLLGTEAEAFQLVVCQSQYTRRWVREYWGRDSLVVNPPIDVPTEEPRWEAKERVVLSVGRFFASGHCKRQDVMVKAFRRMCDSGLEGWELHLVGSVHRTNPADVAYFERVRALAEGYPVRVHADASGEALADLYRRASVYWHAAGYGVDEARRPIDIEHFGMSTAEAMGYGAAPVVIGRGGQVEVVEDGVSGFLWDTPEALVERTLTLVNDAAVRRRMGEAARQASHRFSRAEFKRGMADAIRPVVEELEAAPSTTGA